MTDELVDLVDEKNCLLGIQSLKSEAHKEGLWHRSSHVWIYTDNEEILLQYRSKNKDYFPNRWDVSVAGHVSAGEEPITSAVRELQEEIGLIVKSSKLELFKIRKSQINYGDIINNEFNYCYLLRYNGPKNIFKLQEEEVADIGFFKIDDILKGLHNHPKKYISHGNYWSEVFEAIRRRLVYY